MRPGVGYGWIGTSRNRELDTAQRLAARLREFSFVRAGAVGLRLACTALPRSPAYELGRAVLAVAVSLFDHHGHFAGLGAFLIGCSLCLRLTGGGGSCGVVRRIGYAA